MWGWPQVLLMRRAPPPRSATTGTSSRRSQVARSGLCALTRRSMVSSSVSVEPLMVAVVLPASIRTRSNADLAEAVLGGDHRAPREAGPAQRQPDVLELEDRGGVAGGVDAARQLAADRGDHGVGQPRPELERLGHRQVHVDPERGAELDVAGELDRAAGAARDRLIDAELIVDVVDRAVERVERQAQRRLVAHQQVDVEAVQLEADLGQRHVGSAQVEVPGHVLAAEHGREVVVDGRAQVPGVDADLPGAVVGPVPVVGDLAVDRDVGALVGLQLGVDVERVGDRVAGGPVLGQLGQAPERQLVEHHRVAGRLAGHVEQVDDDVARAQAGPLAVGVRQREVELGHQRVGRVHVEEALGVDVVEPGGERVGGAGDALPAASLAT